MVTRRSRLILYTIALFQVLGLLSAVHAVMSTRTPQGSIAWAVSLVTFPYVTVPAYWVFGRNRFHGYEQAKQEKLVALADTMGQALSGLQPAVRHSARNLGVIKGVESLARVPFTGGNALQLLVDGEVTFNSILEGIDQAENYVLVQFYIVRADGLGNRLASSMKAAAARGVDVYFTYDGVGSLGMPDAYLEDLRAGGVRVAEFGTTRGKGNRFQINFRNHRKIVVVDGDTAWIGGHNVGDEYLGLDPDFGRWRDTHLKIHGPAAIGAQLSFAEDWHWATDEVLRELDWSAQPADQGDSAALVLSSGPADAMETASLMFQQALSSAVRRVWIASPYFVPDDAIVQSIQLAALRGVEVRILIPDKTDNLLVQLSVYSFLDELDLPNVSFHRYTEGFLHQKVLLIDDAVSMIGTANFDNRSFRLNFEVTAITVDRAFNEAVETMLLEDFRNAREMTATEFEERPWWFKLAVRSARLTAPVQ